MYNYKILREQLKNIKFEKVFVRKNYNQNLKSGIVSVFIDMQRRSCILGFTRNLNSNLENTYFYNPHTVFIDFLLVLVLYFCLVKHVPSAHSLH